MVVVRLATAEDAPAVLGMYTPYILQTAFTFETEVPSVEEFRLRIEKYLQKYPWLIAEIDGEVAGYVYGSVHREREAYQWTCECSVYIHDNYKGHGIGSELYEALFEILKLQGFRNVYAGITIPNEASEKLHQKLGFEKFATYENIGCKFGKWHSVGWWRLRLNAYDNAPEPPVPFNKVSRPSLDPILLRAAQKIIANLKRQTR
jgi:L-amino acid N-acyltransferase YncA